MNKQIKMGNRFICGGETFLVAQVGYCKVTLINLKTGNRFREAVTVDDPKNISELEFRGIAGVMFEAEKVWMNK